MSESDNDRDYAGAVDQLQADMAKHQRMFNGGNVTSEANQKLAIETVQRLERQHAEEALRPAAAPPPPPAPVPHHVERKELNGHVYTVDKSTTDVRPYRTATQFEREVLRHAMPRIELLLTKLETGLLGQPSWRDRTLAATFFKVKSLEARQSAKFDLADEYEQRYQQDLYELLEESNKTFGDWRNDAPKPLIIGV